MWSRNNRLALQVLFDEGTIFGWCLWFFLLIKKRLWTCIHGFICSRNNFQTIALDLFDQEIMFNCFLWFCLIDQETFLTCFFGSIWLIKKQFWAFFLGSIWSRNNCHLVSLVLSVQSGNYIWLVSLILSDLEAIFSFWLRCHLFFQEAVFSLYFEFGVLDQEMMFGVYLLVLCSWSKEIIFSMYLLSNLIRKQLLTRICGSVFSSKNDFSK